MDLKAYAKINLTLEVLAKRQDGYHDIRSVVQTIDIADRLIIEEAGGLVLEGDLAGTKPEDNLVMRAARLLQQETGKKPGARLHLRKVIPISSGLGGGSSDAAAALRGLNELWGLGLSIKDLLPLAARLGSDVPFFIHGGTALVEGRGELVTPLPDPETVWYVLAYLPVVVPNKTSEMYARVSERNYTLGDRSKLLAAEIASGKGVAAPHFYNVFEGISFSVFPGLREFYAEFIKIGAENIRLSGSGPTLFCPMPDEEAGRDLLLKCDKRGLPAFLVKTVARQV